MSTVPHSPLCSAGGCPMLGTMTANTSGSSEWWCFLHFGKEAGKLQAITTEINRREWLAKIVTDIRQTYGTEKWPETYRSAKHEMSMQQRNDLHRKSTEKVSAWLFRLERELEIGVRALSARPQRQERMYSEGAEQGALEPA